MNRENNNTFEKIRGFLQDKGVYLVLMLCMAVIGIGAAAAYLPPREVESLPNESPAPASEQVSRSSDDTLSALLTPSPSPAATASPMPDISPAPKPAATVAPRREKAVAPVEGKVQWRFAVDELIYSSTLDQWMTHRGVDLAAPKGAEVRCPWAGTVEEVYEDDVLGFTVKVAHSGGICSFYSNLRSDCPVKEGMLINAGTVVGYVGSSAIAECSDPSHLHFEVTKDGEAVDPMDYVVVIG